MPSVTALLALILSFMAVWPLTASRRLPSAGGSVRLHTGSLAAEQAGGDIDHQTSSYLAAYR
jgi:hypothetical protein